jgi:3-isopropylmalate/(R)-2-methylmalate dehydratase small subunit
MSTLDIRGRAHVYGNNIDTDRIIPGKYTATLDTEALADHVLEDLDPDFRDEMEPGDLIVAGDNFGCGSSREQAPIAIKVAEVSAVVARSFARIFYRNAINIGLPLLEIPEHDISDGDILRADLKTGELTNETTDRTYQSSAMPQVMIDILTDGGLVNYLRKRGDFQV